MTALTALASPARTEEAVLRPVPWRQMTWVIWRQHRAALSGVTVLLAALALFMGLAGPRLHHDYAAAVACHPASSLSCQQLVQAFNGTDAFLANGFLLQVIPALIGAFLAAPLLARELETGTFRYAWTQGFGRRRWALAKLVGLSLAVVAAGVVMSVMFGWYYQPYFAAGNQNLGLTEWPSITPGLFDVRGVTFAAWTLAAVAIGALAGMRIRRVVPAIVATLATYAGLAVLTGEVLRQHYLAPLVTTSGNLPGSAWLVGQQWRTTGGQPVSLSVLNQVLQRGGAQLAGKGGVPKSFDAWQYLSQHGYVQWTSYQPASRFWSFQWIEGGWLLALSVLLIAVTVWLVRRRAV